MYLLPPLAGHRLRKAKKHNPKGQPDTIPDAMEKSSGSFRPTQRQESSARVLEGLMKLLPSKSACQSLTQAHPRPPCR